MTDLPIYFAWYYVIGMVLMGLFIRFYLRKRRLRKLEPPPSLHTENDDKQA
ncbi:MAG: hypothetical protein H8E14_13590 [Candidatus Marinimicrobia bacterium]|nr:hypothetical protein [Candidatus Neomarinimicrobiota bacterium]